MLDWQTYPKRGTSWIETTCGTYRLLKCFNEPKPASETHPAIEPVTYLLFCMTRGKKRLIGSFVNLKGAKDAANSAK